MPKTSCMQQAAHAQGEWQAKEDGLALELEVLCLLNRSNIPLILSAPCSSPLKWLLDIVCCVCLQSLRIVRERSLQGTRYHV
jgi:hypothetical protein